MTKSKDPTAHLRRQSRGVWASADRLDRDNTRAVIDYMRERSPIVADVFRRMGNAAYGCIRLHVEPLPWNQAAPKRVVAMTITEETACSEPRRGMSQRQRNVWRDTNTTTTTVPIPHWDYDGVDPLIAREPWERMEADNWIGSGEQDAGYSWERDSEVHNLECAEFLIAEGNAGVASMQQERQHIVDMVERIEAERNRPVAQVVPFPRKTAKLRKAA